MAEKVTTPRKMKGPGFRASLSGKVLALTIIFVMLGEVLIFLPSIANFRIQWFKSRISRPRSRRWPQKPLLTASSMMTCATRY